MMKGDEYCRNILDRIKKRNIYAVFIGLGKAFRRVPNKIIVVCFRGKKSSVNG